MALALPRGVLAHAAGLAALMQISGIPAAAHAQSRPFVFTQLAGAEAGAPRAIVFGDLAYGHNMFAALGPENLEQRIGVQFRLGSRVSVVAQSGWVSSGAGTSSRVTGQAEILGNLLPADSRAILAIGAGAMRDYRSENVALGRAIAGYRWIRTLLVANVRLAHSFRSSDANAPVRDGIDVSSTLGLSREITPSLRIGIESVAEDLEGILDPSEAEGGAKLMVGPSIRLGAPRTRWGVLMVAGPVLRLSQSSVTSTGSGATRDLSQAGGYVVRTSLAYRW